MGDALMGCHSVILGLGLCVFLWGAGCRGLECAPGDRANGAAFVGVFGQTQTVSI